MLSPEESICVNIIFEDCLSKLKGVAKDIPVPTKSQRPLGPIDEMHDTELWHQLLPVELNNPIDISSEWQELQRLQTLRDHLEDLFVDMIKEIGDTNSYSSLTTNLEKRRLKILEELQIFIKEDVTVTRLNELQSQILPKSQKASDASRKDDSILYLKDRLQRDKIRCLNQVKYAKKQADAYINQVKKKGELEEERIRNKLESLMNNVDAEERTHDALMKSLEKSIQKLEETADYWKHKFAEDVSLKDEEIEDKKSQREHDKKIYENTVKLIEEQTKIIQDDRAIKAEIKRKEEEERKELESATRIQSWWRGLMVRKCLGPFRKYKHLLKTVKKKGKKVSKSKEATSGEDSDAQQKQSKEKKTKGKKKPKAKPKPKPKKKEKKSKKK